MRTLFLVALTLAVNSPRAGAGFYVTQASFDAATAGLARFTEDFDTQLPGFGGETGANPSSLAFAGPGGFGFTASGGTLLYQSQTGGLGDTHFLGMASNGHYLRLDFTVTVTAFSGHFFNTDAADTFYPGQPITLLLDNGDTFTHTPTDVAGSFVGYVSAGPPIGSVRLANAADFENAYSAVDRVTALENPAPPASATPLPPTLLLAGVAGLIAVARQSRRTPK